MIGKTVGKYRIVERLGCQTGKRYFPGLASNHCSKSAKDEKSRRVPASSSKTSEDNPRILSLG